MPVAQLTDLLIPYWKAAGYEFDPVGGRAWLEQLTSLIGPSLTRLTDAVEMSRLFFTKLVDYSEEAIAQLKQEGANTAIEIILTALDSHQQLTEAGAQEIIKQVTKQNLKKGLVMRSLRAALTGDLHGPDLIQSWLILHQLSFDRPRLQQAIASH
jgi:glutamyl-tRNA synthetase